MLLKLLNWLFTKKPKPIVLKPMSESWIKEHIYDSGKEKPNDSTT